MKFFASRQPILNRKLQLTGHQILFRNAASTALEEMDMAEHFGAIAQAADQGIENLFGDLPGYLCVDAETLLGDAALFLPQKTTVLVVQESIGLTPPVLARISELRKLGFKFATEGGHNPSADALHLLQSAEIVLFRAEQLKSPLAPDLLRRLKAAQKKLLATQIEDQEQFEHCANLGVDYFQGSVFVKPVVDPSKKFSPSELAIVEILTLLEQDADDIQIENRIKRDASIGVNLLKLVNSVGVGGQRIGSLKQALMVVGRAPLRKWLQYMLYEKPGNEGRPSPLLHLASTRGKLLELAAQKLLPNSRTAPDLGFMVGIMSLMDCLFAKPMEEVLSHITVFNEVRLALLERKGFYGDLLRVAEDLERLEVANPDLLPALAHLKLDGEDLYALELSAFAWVDQMVV